MKLTISGQASDFDRLHEIAVRKHGCLLVRPTSGTFRAIAPESADFDTLKEDLMSIKGVKCVEVTE